MKVTNLVSLNEYMDTESESGYAMEIPDKKQFAQPEKVLEENELKKMLSAEHYVNFKDFRNRAIEPATKEINQYTD